EVCVGAIALHVEVVFLDLWIAPFFVLADREWQGGVKHGVQDIDERYVADHCVKKVRAQIDDSAHQQSPRTAAFNDELFVVCVALSDEMFRSADEIGEGGALLAHAAGIIPRFAKFTPAANVGNRIDDATIKQAQTIC